MSIFRLSHFRLRAGWLLPLLLALPLQASCAQELSAAEIAAVRGDGIDRNTAPGNDFNRYANGGWADRAVIPASKTSVGVFDMLADESDASVLAIMRRATQAADGSPERKIGDFFQAYLNTERIQQRGLAPLQPRLDAIAAINSQKELARYLGQNLRADVDPINNTHVETENLFGLWVSQGLHDHKKYLPYLLQGGLGLPDREYYVSLNPKMIALRVQYQHYIAAMLALANVPHPELAARRVFDLEMKIAKGHATREATSDVLKADNSWRRTEFAKKAPGLDWNTYFAAAGLEAQPVLTIWHPGAVRNSAALAGSVSLETWKEYLIFHAVNQRAGVLPQAFFEQKFAFYSALSGVKEPLPRWKYAVSATNEALGEEVGKLYVQEHFSAAAKEHIRGMVDNLLQAFARRVQTLGWMSPRTKAEALAKIQNTYVGVGYPDQWRDYAGLLVAADDAYGNRERAELFQYQQALAKFGKPVDVREWCMNPQLVNAVNMPLQNAINFPAAYLQSPNFDLHASDATNYGAIGATIGHEISHSFDNSGAMFDARGELRNWWSKADLQHFMQSSKALAAQFSSYRPFPDLAVNGQQTLGENIADLAGLTAAYDAYHASMAQKGQAVTADTEREFFLSYARSFRSKVRDEILRTIIITNEHAPEQYRVQTVRNLDAWYQAFDVQPGQTLYLTPKDRVRIW
ncbi:M13 family metallopeptidase [Undibacterium oligocarboniphilum]|uniref:M13 family metallopeptidase n=1 Tax=Undibacterium oligocarboniphilum TaxID=666702 RepID=A0A850QE26_9BURK|nr:M13 family metallopeptidase [Undibacterium oligocarboniphilum]MBC3869452.1 M13 family metallopeptidase [Undibacterium oligocarboniphilum]NVO77831.1 M13 family metallopeptidase [Undibacterium oligocarboniphilum]